MFTSPSVDDFKTYFERDFPFGCDVNENVLDSDISRAIDTSLAVINDCLFGTQAEYNLAFYLFTAHNLIINLRNSSQGLSSKFSWPVASHGVSSVSEGFSIPQDILSNPLYSYYMRSGYGGQYLMLVWPKLYGNMFSVKGATTA